MPMSRAFENRLYPIIAETAEHFGTPFHIYDESGILETGKSLISAFSQLKGFREYYAVKALPNPAVLKIMRDLGFGFDCSSIAELVLSRQIGARGDDIMFTSNNTSSEEFAAAADNGGCILNLDDISLLPKVPRMPELICLRYNPGPTRTGNSIIGNPVDAVPEFASLVDDPRFDELQAAMLANANADRKLLGLPLFDENFETVEEPHPV